MGQSVWNLNDNFDWIAMFLKIVVIGMQKTITLIIESLSNIEQQETAMCVGYGNYLKKSGKNCLKLYLKEWFLLDTGENAPLYEIHGIWYHVHYNL